MRDLFFLIVLLYMVLLFGVLFPVYMLCFVLISIFAVCKGFEGEGNRIQNYYLPRRYPWNRQVSYFSKLILFHDYHTDVLKVTSVV